MKNSIRISITSPCAERWENLTTSSTGGFCNSCSKNVIDFTSMPEDAIRRFFANRPSHTCGRFRADQLKSYSITPLPQFRPGLTLLRAGIMSALLAFAGQEALAQSSGTKVPTQQTSGVSRKAELISSDIVVRGIVRDETGAPLPGANILLAGTQKGTVSDTNGRFEFPQKLKVGDTLVFTFIGFKPITYAVNNSVEPLDIELKFSETEFILLGEVSVDGPSQAPRGLRGVWNRLKHIF